MKKVRKLHEELSNYKLETASLYYMGIFHEMLENYEDCLKTHTKVTKRNTKNSFFEEGLKYRSYYHIGKIKYMKKDFQESSVALVEFCSQYTCRPEIFDAKGSVALL